MATEGSNRRGRSSACAARAPDLALQSDGKLTDAGSRGGDRALARSDTDGSPDTGLAGAGDAETCLAPCLS
ncbi:hypothetical protein [Streptomyces sp. P10-4]|uniref:hypothetical protein n=1 Tax=Streptomyces sp. P10-4 TaxID=3421645 RepID=UPI003D282338